MPEENMMSQRSKRKLLQEIRPRYLKAKKVEKKTMLDEFAASTGYHRKYATRILKHGYPRQSGKRHGYHKVYQGEVVVALEQIWEICGRICSKRLHPFLPEMVKVLERCGELQLSEQTKALLLQMSRSTIDRCLGPARFEHPHGLSTTKPGSLLKKAIPVRTFTPWDEDKPGFLEIDLMAHCGGSVEGQFINTLTCVDLSTGWIECLAVHHRSQQAVFEAIQTTRTYLCPFSCSASTQTMAMSLSTICSTNIVFPKRSLSPVRVPTRRTTRLMSNTPALAGGARGKTGPSSAA